MTNRFLSFSAPGIAGLNPYLPGKPISELERELGITNSIKLASNENPLGPSKKAKAIINGQLEDLARYPDGGGFALRNALAKRHGVDPSYITLGNGSNDVLDMIARVFLSSGSEAIFSEYAFAVYPIVTQAVGAKSCVAKAKDYGHDLEAMLQLITDKTRVIFIANPNNPTGTWLSSDSLKSFIDAVPDSVIIVVDEAYVEYVDEAEYPDASNWLKKYDNLIVTRTFSKAYALASLRIGYSLSHPDITDLLNRVRQPFNTNSFAQSAALAALDDVDHLQKAIDINKQGMSYFEASFKTMGLEWIPSVGNFITVDLRQDTLKIDKLLLQEGVITRPVANYGLPNHLRISIGLDEENKRCVETLKKVLTL